MNLEDLHNLIFEVQSIKSPSASRNISLMDVENIFTQLIERDKSRKSVCENGTEAPQNHVPVPEVFTQDDLFYHHEHLCEIALKLMKAKNTDYGGKQDTFHSFRSFGSLGILVRLSDKLSRLQAFETNGTLEVKDESVKDTVLDIINYAVLYYSFLLSEKKTQ